MEQPTEWRNWGVYALSREGYLVVATVIPNGKPVGTYLVPRTIGSDIPRYRITKKGAITTYKISDLLKKVWNDDRVVTLAEVENMRICAIAWNEARRDLNKTRRSRLPVTKITKPYVDVVFDEDPFTHPSHPQSDPFSNWR